MPKRSNGFDKDPERARLAGRKSKKITKELTEALNIFSSDFKTLVLKYMHSDISDLKQIMLNPKTKAVDLVVIKLLVKAIEAGDYSRLDFLLNRTIGKVKEDINLDVTNSTHRSIVEQIKSRDVAPEGGEDE